MFSKLKSNNKGYMLVEIILAFSIAFILLYFIIDLVIKMKNTNDDLLVKTLVYTDQSIVSNGLMDLITDDIDNFSCSDLKIEGNVIKYGTEVVDIVSDYAEIDKANYVCKDNVANKIMINIPISVKQLPDEDFSIDIDYRYGPNDTEIPVCNFSVDSAGKLTAKCYDVGIEGVEPSGIESYMWDDEEDYTMNEDNSEVITTIKDIDKKEHIIIVIDNAGNKGEFIYYDNAGPICSLKVSNGVISLSSFKDNGSDGNNASGIKSYQWNGEITSFSSSTKSINGTGEYTLTINDYAGNSGSCKVTVSNLSTYEECPNSGTPDTGCYHYIPSSTKVEGSCYCSDSGNGSGFGAPGICVGANECDCPTGSKDHGNSCSQTTIYEKKDDTPLTKYKCVDGTSSTGNEYCYK